jgi:hypothetical protein
MTAKIFPYASFQKFYNFNLKIFVLGLSWINFYGVNYETTFNVVVTISLFFFALCWKGYVLSAELSSYLLKINWLFLQESIS